MIHKERLGRCSTGEHRDRNAGFTLLEMLLSVALIVAVAAVGIPVYQSYQVRNDLDIAEVSIVHSLRRAQLLARAMDQDAPWGVYVASGRITLFEGVSYSARNSGLDELFDAPTSLVISGVQEIVFSKFFGKPQPAGTMTLTAVNGATRNITINEQGTVNY